MRTLLLAAGVLALGLLGSAYVLASEEIVQEAPDAVVARPVVVTPELPVVVTPKLPVVVTPELIEAHHAYQLAQLRWQQYRFVELPRQRRFLDDQVRLSESAIRVLERRLRDYRPLLLAGRYSPVRTAAENDRLTLQSTKQALRQLKTERINLMRYSRQNAQLYRLDVLRHAARVRQVMNQK